MTTTATLLSDQLPACTLGEGIIWDHHAQILYWVDIDGKQLHSYNPATAAHRTFHFTEKIPFILPTEQGDLLAALGDKLHIINKNTGKTTPHSDPQIPQPARFNDAVTDSRGRLIAGTMSLAEPRRANAVLYRYEQGAMKIFDQGYTITNGLGLAPDEKTLYHSDTGQKTIWAYDYDIRTGAITNRRLFAKNHGNGKPDGLCVDSAGFVYSAQWDGGAINVHAPDGNLVEMLKIPARNVTSCCFGGADLRTLYISTAGDKIYHLPRLLPGLVTHPVRTA